MCKQDGQENFNFYELLSPFFSFLQAHFKNWTKQHRKECFDYIEIVLSVSEASYAESMEVFVVHGLDLIDDGTILKQYMGRRTAEIFEIWKD